ncbi:MAG: SMC-Scp complex subunit ScpB [Candidatus Kerfeldbacteria bacterium]|nr:SMC-Scp complex subunit ScpB [Candidatus Kerfeldbacteria bacterium]
MTTSAPGSLSGKLESILFASGKPLSFKHLAEVCEVTVGDIEAALTELQQGYNQTGHGLILIIHQNQAALATHPDNTELVRQFLKKEELGELTRPQLEALSVITYRGPISKADLEQVRGVNCSLILRNLQIRGLVEAVDDESVIPRYQVSIDFLRFLGVSSVRELPNYDSLSTHANLEQILATAEKIQA